MSVESIIFKYSEDETVIKSSAILINKRWVILPAASMILNLHAVRKIPTNHLWIETSKIIQTNILNISSMNSKITSSESEKKIKRQNVKYVGIFSCNNIKRTKNLPITSGERNNELEYDNFLSLFLIFDVMFDVKFNENDFFNSIIELLKECSGNIKRGTDVCIESSPMASLKFFNSFSQGIVCNLLGKHSCFILTDAPTAPGSEGGVIYTFQNNNKNSKMIPIGIVVAPINFWRGEHIGLTLGVTLVPLLAQLLPNQLNLKVPILSKEESVMSYVDKAIVQVFCGNGWGTGILINKELGVFITASHVVNSANVDDIIFKWQNIKFPASLIFRSQNTFAYDIAVLKCDTKYTQYMNSIKYATEPAKKGEMVVAAGYPIFKSKNLIYPVFTKGNISLAEDCIIHTTCCILGGASGGAILNQNAELLGIIVCHTTVSFTNTLIVYPKINMAIPILAIYNTLTEYIKTNDVTVLKKLEVSDPRIQKMWKLFQFKL